MNRVYSVSQINSYIHRIFDGDYALRKIDIKGEVSNCKYHSSGHVYFTLKDAKSAIRCVMFSSDRSAGLTFRLMDGQQVTVSGRISVFERDGSYQLYARSINKTGSGELYLRYELLKKELYEAGYFDFERKKDLPPYPERIGIVTAATGAAIQDIRSIAARRNPYVQLILYPAKVQGQGAAASIAAGIRYFDRNDVDIIIIGRGGGSIEDLWAFNERELADAIYQAKTPIISGTGHEVDMTIADYCADVRAATPSAACELAIPEYDGLLMQLADYRNRLDQGMEWKLAGYRQRYDRLKSRIAACHPGSRLIRQQMQLSGMEKQMNQRMRQILTDYRYRMELLAQRLTAASPSSRLKGGYVFAHDLKGHPISSVEQTAKGRPFGLIFSDGELIVAPVKDQAMKPDTAPAIDQALKPDAGF